MTEYVFRIHDAPRMRRASWGARGFSPRVWPRTSMAADRKLASSVVSVGGGEHRHGRGRERMFDAGDVKLVILKLLSEQPSYGYQLIKTMEERLAGGYCAQPRSDLSHAHHAGRRGPGGFFDRRTTRRCTPSLRKGRHTWRRTSAGSRPCSSGLEEAGKGFERGRSPEIMKAFHNLRGAVVARVSRESVTAEQIRKISEAINAAAKAIDEL